ncbi:hypothetical protein ACJ73_08815 [Blastomyces percursus]|uniref:Uncharacterized protein n=1 Tax=Blastomyces percursus TaxID=1658174 RepID=A0A1J9QPU2_9EURO|nr:hypothetical protein ACJ73_08815 [Blastomyces percursus]
MDNGVAQSQAQSSGGMGTCSSPVMSYFHERISKLQRSVYEAILSRGEGNQLTKDSKGYKQYIEELRLEQKVLGELIDWRIERKQEQTQSFQDECNSHVMTMNELMTEKRFHIQIAEANAKLQEALEVEQQRHQGTIMELNDLRR